MAVETQVIRFQKSTGGNGTTQDVNLNFTPKAIFLFSDQNTADNTVSAVDYNCHGFSDGTNHACVSTGSRDNASAGSTGRIHSNTYVYIKLHATNVNTTSIVRGTVAFATNKVTFTWTLNDAVATYITLLAIGGSDISNVKVNTVDVNTTSTGTTDYTGLGFTLTSGQGVLFTMDALLAATDTNSSNAAGSFGCAVSDTKRWSMSYISEHTSDPSDTYRYYSSSNCFNNITTNGALSSSADFDSWISDGFRLDWTDAPAGSTTKISYMVIKGGTWDAGNLQSPTSPTNNVDTSVSVSSSTLRSLLMSTVAVGTLDTATADKVLSIGATDGTTQGCIGLIDEDGAPTTDNYCVNNTVNIIRPLTTNGGALDTATFDSFTTNNFRLDWGAADATARYYGWVVVADSTSILYERGITESSISVSDSNTRTLTANRALPESSISVSDSNTRLLTAMRPIAEPSISVNDSNTRLRTAFAPISEASITVSDDLARTKIVPRSINESTITVGDSLARLLTAFRTISEPSITVSETVSGNKLISTSINEPSITVSDSLARVLIATRSLSESSISVSDDLARVKTIIRLINESTITVSDSLARTIIRVRSITEDAISVSDALARLLIAVRTISEDVDVSDTLARILIASRTISENSITVSDALARTVVFPRSISEPSISVSDSLTRLLLANRAISESSISVSDALARVLIIVRAIAEDVDVSDSLARLLIATRTLADTITVSDLLAGQLIFLREIDEDPITVGDSVDTDETKLALIFEPAITVSDSLVRRLSAFRTISETVTVSDLLVGAKPVPVLAEYITDEGYTNPIRFRVTFKSRKSDTLADESGDQIIYYQYDSFVPEARPFNITDFSLKLTQGEISAASLTIEDHKELIGDPRKIGFKSVVEVDFKKELGRSWERILTGFVRRVRTLRPANKALSYGVTILSKQIVDSERIINFKRAAKRGSVDSVEALTTDSNMAANKLFKEIYNSINHFPRKNSPAVKDTGEYDLDTGSISDEVIDFITEIAPGLTTVAETTNQLTEGIGAIKGVDEFGNPYLRYPTEKHSGIVITDNPQDLDSALNTSVNMASFEFEDSIDIAEGFANRLYVLNSKEAKSTASSSKASGFTTLTTRWIAQSFTADDNNVTSAAFILSKTGNPTNTAGTIKGLLRASSSNGNFPTGSTLATFEISFSQLTNAKDTIFVNDIKTKDGAIVIGQKYWWVLQGTGLFDDTHTVNWHHDNDLATTGRPRSAKLPLVDTDPTKPGNQFNWISSPVAEVYAFSTFSSVNHILTQSDPESIKENGLIEAVVSLPAFNDDATYQKVLVKIIKDSAKIKRIFNYTRVTIPTAKLFKPGELVTVVDSKAKLDIEKVINAEIVEVTYNFDTNSNALGCKYVDLRLVGFIDNVTNDYLENKEC